MQSRMEKFHDTNGEELQRTSRNEDLYKSIYDDVEYTNIEGVVTSPKANEVDLSKIRELLKRDEEKKNRIVKEPKEIKYPEYDILEEERSYDVMDILSKAKQEKVEDTTKYRSFANTEYDILKGIDIKKKEEKDLKEMIENVTKPLNQMGDKELSLDMLNDLQATTKIEGDEVEPISEKTSSLDEIDKSFFTSSLGLQEKDFEELKDMNTSIQKDNKMIKILLFIMLFMIIGVSVFVVLSFI